MAVTLTDAAAERVRSFLVNQPGKAGLRVGVKPAGCSGLSYIMDFADEAGEDDTVFEDHGIKVIVDSDSLPYIDGMVLDFSKEGLNEGFTFNNPNVKSTCGCGTSFSV
ncbi:MAG: iron-sulfur cluster assembly protein IscA [Gammaproteobacteria bacterium]